MNKIQGTLMNLLQAGINEDYTDFSIDKSLNMEYLYEEAMSHQIHTLIFPVLRKYSKELHIEEAFMEKRRKEFLQDVALQESHAEQMGKVLKAFHLNQIPVIILKGLVLRNYYPFPSLRLMGDGDILIKKETLEVSKELLKSLGYKPGKSTLKHLAFRYGSYPPIELHTLLSDCEIDGIGDAFTDSAWENALCSSFLDIPVLKLSIYDQLVHLILHAGQHMNSGGFGLRQLCDIVLYLQVHIEEINWNTLFHFTRKYQIERFSLALLAVCQKLFCINLSIPESAELEEAFLDLFIEDIFDGGVYGRKTTERFNSSKMVKYINKGNTKNRFGSLGNFFALLFPPSLKLRKNYPYIINRPYLLVLAWLHRMVRNAGRFITFRMGKDLNKINENRFRLLSWLQLR